MITAEQTALILLAAGRSSRFAGGNKLEQPFLGRPVGFYVVTTLESIPFMHRIAIVDGCTLDFAALGYKVLTNDDPSLGMSRSVKLGVEHARAIGAEAVLIALADMPRVTASHIYRLLDAADGDDAVVASSDGVEPKPPALFGRGRFDTLLTLSGDAGARDLIKGGHHVVTKPAELIDIDTREDFARLEELTRSRDPIRAATHRSG